MPCLCVPSLWNSPRLTSFLGGSGVRENGTEDRKRVGRALQTKLFFFKMFNWTLTPCGPQNLSLIVTWTFSLTEIHCPDLHLCQLHWANIGCVGRNILLHLLEESQSVPPPLINSLRVPGPWDATLLHLSHDLNFGPEVPALRYVRVAVGLWEERGKQWYGGIQILEIWEYETRLVLFFKNRVYAYLAFQLEICWVELAWVEWKERFWF